MLTERYVNDRLAGLLLPREQFRPYPAVDNREPWESLPAFVKEKCLSAGEAYLGYSWPTLPASRYMDFARNGNRTRYQDLYFARRDALARLVIAECIENRGRFMEDIVNGIWAICEESYWVVPAHLYISVQSRGDALPDVADPVIDLFAAETSSLLAWTHYLLRPRLDAESRMLAGRIRQEITRRILDPFLERDDFWWMGFSERKNVNNWNPWIHSNCLASFLLIEEDENRRTEGIRKSLRSLDAFLAIHHADGGCDEGPGYWGRAGASLFDCLELLYLASDGNIDLYGEPLVKEIGRYIYRAHIAGDWFVNFADGDARLRIDADVVYRFGKRIGDERMAALGASAYRKEGGARRLSLERAIPALFNEETLAAAAAVPPHVRDVWLDGIQFMAAREREGEASGLFLAAKGGHNSESHNHNDVGHFIVYADGRPFLIDIGVEEYTAKTFSPSRYEIWTMQSAYHNLPLVRGVQQQPGRQFRAAGAAYSMTDDLAELSLDITAAYPDEAGISAWKRTYRLHRGGEACIEIVDDFKLREAADDLVLHLVTTCRPEFASAGAILLQDSQGGGIRIDYDGESFDAAGERLAVEDHRLQRVWGQELFRIRLQAKAPAFEGAWSMKIRQM